MTVIANMTTRSAPRSIVEDIHQVLDRRTDSVRPEIQEKVDRKLQVANQLLQKKEALFSNIYYLDGVYDFCQNCNWEVVGEPDREALKHMGRQLKNLKRANLEGGDVDDLMQMRNDLLDFVHRNFSSQEGFLQHMQVMADGRDLGMNDEVREIQNIVTRENGDAADRTRLQNLQDKIIQRRDEQQYTIETDFTLT